MIKFFRKVFGNADKSADKSDRNGSNSTRRKQKDTPQDLDRNQSQSMDDIFKVPTMKKNDPKTLNLPALTNGVSLDNLATTQLLDNTAQKDRTRIRVKARPPTRFKDSCRNLTKVVQEESVEKKEIKNISRQSSKSSLKQNEDIKDCSAEEKNSNENDKKLKVIINATPSPTSPKPLPRRSLSKQSVNSAHSVNSIHSIQSVHSIQSPQSDNLITPELSAPESPKSLVIDSPQNTENLKISQSPTPRPRTGSNNRKSPFEKILESKKVEVDDPVESIKPDSQIKEVEPKEQEITIAPELQNIYSVLRKPTIDENKEIDKEQPQQVTEKFQDKIPTKSKVDPDIRIPRSKTVYIPEKEKSNENPQIFLRNKSASVRINNESKDGDKPSWIKKAARAEQRWSQVPDGDNLIVGRPTSDKSEIKSEVDDSKSDPNGKGSDESKSPDDKKTESNIYDNVILSPKKEKSEEIVETSPSDSKVSDRIAFNTTPSLIVVTTTNTVSSIPVLAKGTGETSSNLIPTSSPPPQIKPTISSIPVKTPNIVKPTPSPKQQSPIATKPVINKPKPKSFLPTNNKKEDIYSNPESGLLKPSDLMRRKSLKSNESQQETKKIDSIEILPVTEKIPNEKSSALDHDSSVSQKSEQELLPETSPSLNSTKTSNNNNKSKRPNVSNLTKMWESGVR